MARRAPVVVLDGVLEERDAVAARREARIAEVPARLGEHLSDRILEAVLAVDVARDREVRAVGRPVGLAHAVHDLARRAAFDRHPRERSEEDAVPKVARVGQDRELALRRDGEQCHPGLAGRRGAGIVRPQREDLGRVARGRRAVEDGLAVGREARVEDRLLAKRELSERDARGPRRRPCAARAPTRPRGPRATSAAAGTGASQRRRDDGSALGATSRPDAETPESASRSKARSCAEWKRCSGFFSRQCRTIRSRPGRDVLVRDARDPAGPP